MFHETTVTNVASHSFGVVALNRERNEFISNLVFANEQIPATKTNIYGTAEDNQAVVEIRIMENNEATESADPELGRQIGIAVIENLPPRLPAGSRIEVTFELNEQQRLHVTARDLTGGATIEATIETTSGLSEDEMAEAQARGKQLMFV